MLFTVQWGKVVLSNQGVEEIKELKGWASKGVNTNQGIKGVENDSQRYPLKLHLYQINNVEGVIVFLA